MKIQNLRFFAAVLEYGGVTQAAQRMHVTQPAVSAGLKALEDELGAPLFERTGGRRRMVPTARALRFHPQAIEILRQCDAALTAFRAPAVRQATVRLGVLRTIAAEAAAAVASELARGGDQRWTIREGGAEELMRWLRQGRIDVAWTTLEAETTDAEALWQEPFVMLVPRGHRLARSRSQAVTITELDGEPIILRASCELKSGRLQAAGIEMRIVARAERDALALRLVAAGIGVAVAPRSLATADAVPVPIVDLGLSRIVGIRWRPDFSAEALDRLRTAVLTFGRPK